MWFPVAVGVSGGTGSLVGRGLCWDGVSGSTPMMVMVVMLSGVRYFPKGILPRATTKLTISQLAISQMCNFPSGNFPKVRINPLRCHRLQWGPSAAARGPSRKSL